MRTKAERVRLRASLLTCAQCGRYGAKSTDKCPTFRTYSGVEPPDFCQPRPPRVDIEREETNVQLWTALNLLDEWQPKERAGDAT
jgi:hypothetical protein